MSVDSIICDVCSENIRRRDLPGHIELHQVQLLSLIRKLQAPRGPELDFEQSEDDTDDSEFQNISPGGPHEPQHGEEGGNLASNQRFRKRRKKLKCPHWDRATKKYKCPDCPGRWFNRKQEFVRHYVTHYECDEFCPICSTTYHEASKFMYHHCSKFGPAPEQQRIKEWCQSLFLKVEIELCLRRAGMSTGTADLSKSARLKFRQPETSRDTVRSGTAPTAGVLVPIAEAAAQEALPSTAPLMPTSELPFLAPDAGNQSNDKLADGDQSFQLFDNPLFQFFDITPAPMQQIDAALWKAFPPNRHQDMDQARFSTL